MKTSIGITVASYRNHVVYTSVYAALFASCVQQATTEGTETFFAALWYFGAGLALFLIKGEAEYMIQRSRLPPGDSGYPVIGHLPMLIKGPYELSSDHHKKYGSMHTLNLLGNPVVSLDSDEDATWFMTQERKGNLVGGTVQYMKELIGNDIIMFAVGKQHKRLRRIFDPAYSPATLKNYVELMDEIAQQMLKEWADTKDYQSEQQWSMLAMKIFCACTFGQEFNHNEEKLHHISTLFDGWLRGASFPLKFPGSPLSKGHNYKKQLDDLVESMVEEFQKQCTPESKEADSTVMGRLCYGVDDDGNRLSQEQLVSNIRFLMFAGHDTIKGSFSAFLKYLMENPSVHEALLQEVQNWDSLDSGTLKEAPILNAFLLESWRLAAPVNVHATKAQIDLEYKGYIIPAQTEVVLNIQNYNFRNTTRFPSPDKFNIGRFVPPGHELHNPELYAAANEGGSVRYRTFNVGTHSCLGIHFAKLEAAIVLTRLLQEYDIQIKNERLNKFPLRQVALDFLLTPRKK